MQTILETTRDGFAMLGVFVFVVVIFVLASRWWSKRDKG